MLRPIFDPASVLASTVSSTVNVADSIVSEVGTALSGLARCIVLIRAEPIVVPIPLLPLWPLRSTTRTTPQLGLAERTSRVSSILISPYKYVGYIAASVTFVAMGRDILGELTQGAKFTFESSDPTKLTIDEAGRASLLQPGTVIVTARAGLAVKTAPVLIRPTRRRVQTDAEWRADQDSLVADGRLQTDDGLPGLLASLGEALMPTAHAQGGGQGADYGNAAPVGQVGTPPFAALEETRLGPVMPQTNFELPIALVDLGGRGLATSLMAYYNSNPWGAYVDGLGQTHYVFDPIQGWPSPGFSLGFGRIVIYTYAGPGYQYMFIDPNGTRHSLELVPTRAPPRFKQLTARTSHTLAARWEERSIIKTAPR